MDHSDRTSRPDRNKMRDFVAGAKKIEIINRYSINGWNDLRIPGDRIFYRVNDEVWTAGSMRPNNSQLVEMLNSPDEAGDIIRYTKDNPDRPEYYRDFE